MNITNNLEFRAFLNIIHGQTVVDGVMQNNILKFKDEEKIWDFIMHYKRNQDNSSFCLKDKTLNKNCPIPPKTSKNPQETDTRIIEFQNWGGKLDLSSKSPHKKEIMIIGESVVGDVTQYRIPSYKSRLNTNLDNIPDRIVINLSWGLNLNFQTGDDLVKVLDYLDEPEKYFWIYLKRLLRRDYRDIINSIYITDIAHCNAEKHTPTLENCAKIYFLTELFAINPEIIILLGNDAKRAFFRQIKNLNFRIIPKTVELELENSFYKQFKNFDQVKYPQAGEIVYEEKECYRRYKFVNIPHPSRAERRYKEDPSFWDALRNWLIEFRMINEPYYIARIHKVLDHGISHLKEFRTPFNFQIAMISIDNSVELTLKAYLGIRYYINFHSLLKKLKPNLPDGFFERVPSFLSLELLIPEWKLLDNPLKNTKGDFINLIKGFHKLRNNLYHNVIKEDVRRKIVVIYASLARYLIDKLLNKNKSDIIVNISNPSKLIDQFLKLWKKIEDRIKLFFFDAIEITYDYNLPFALDVLLHEHMIDIKTNLNLLNIRILKRELKKGFDISSKKLQESFDYLVEFESELEDQIKWYYDNEEAPIPPKKFRII